MTAHTFSESRIFDEARLHLPSAMPGTMRLEFFNVMKEFLQRTNIWQDEISVDVDPGTYDYPLPTNQAGAFINRLMWLEGKRSDVNRVGSGSVVVGILLSPGAGEETLRISTPPSTSEAWYAHVALSVVDPTDEAGMPQAPKWLYDKYHSTLTEGLLSRMMTHPAKPYSSAAGALLHGRRFEKGVSVARAEAKHGFAYDANAWRFPQAFRSGSQRRGGFR